MKRMIIYIGVFLCLIICGTDTNLLAQSLEYQGIMYEILDSGKVRVRTHDTYQKKICRYSGKLNIPDNIVINDDVFIVSDIADSFRGCVNLKEIRLPNGLEFIGNMAFYECFSLKHVELPNNISCIYDKAFSRCKSLRSIRLPAKLHVIKDSAFEECKRLKRIDIPKDVNYIGSYAFFGCKGLREIYVYSANPPTISSNTTASFIGIRKSIHIHIPKGSRSLYQSASGWSLFTNYVDDL